MTENTHEESRYEVNDKRRFNSDGSSRTEASEVQAPAEDPTEPQETVDHNEQTDEEGRNLDVYSLSQLMVGMMAEQAWYSMGLRIAPGRKELFKDLVQAKIAVDTVAFLADKLHPQLSEDDRKALRTLVSDLQINFVRQG